MTSSAPDADKPLATLTADDRATLRTLVEQRSSMYGFLSRVYEKEVDATLLDQMCAMRMLRDTGNADVDAAYAELSRFLSSRWERTEEDLRVDYVRTFFGNGMSGFDAAYPFESVHTSSERLMMQGARDEVLALYRSEGFDKSETWKDNEDHVALELAFEKILCDKVLAALVAGDDEAVLAKLVVQRNFLSDHLLNWVPLLAGGVEHFSQSAFYPAIARLTLGFLREDLAFLDEFLLEEGIGATEKPVEVECIPFSYQAFDGGEGGE